MANYEGNLISSCLLLLFLSLREVKGQNDQENQINILTVALTAVFSVAVAIAIIVGAVILLTCFLKYLKRRGESMEERNETPQSHDYESPLELQCRPTTIEDGIPLSGDDVDIKLDKNVCYVPTPSRKRRALNESGESRGCHGDRCIYDDIIPSSGQQSRSQSPGYENVDPISGLPVAPDPNIHLRSPTSDENCANEETVGRSTVPLSLVDNASGGGGGDKSPKSTSTL